MIWSLLLALVFLLPLGASADPLTLYSSFGPTDAFDPSGLHVTGAAPNPASQGLRVGFHAFAPIADYVQIEAFDSIVYALSTAQDWSDAPGLATYMSLFADEGGAPGVQLAGAYVYWPLAPTPALFRSGAGAPFSLPLSTSSFYWFTLSVRDGFDGSFDPSRTMTWHFAEGTRTPGLRLIGNVVPIPEPVTTLLLSAGLLASAGWNWRRRQGTPTTAPPVV